MCFNIYLFYIYNYYHFLLLLLKAIVIHGFFSMVGWHYYIRSMVLYIDNGERSIPLPFISLFEYPCFHYLLLVLVLIGHSLTSIHNRNLNGLTYPMEYINIYKKQNVCEVIIIHFLQIYWNLC